MSKFVYVEFEIKGMNNKSIVASKGYLNIDYIVSIPVPLSNRMVELHTGCIDEMEITSGTKYYTLTEKTFNNLIKKLDLKERK